jgi:tetratricopeptide (TPR) repeat protein
MKRSIPTSRSGSWRRLRALAFAPAMAMAMAMATGAARGEDDDQAQPATARSGEDVVAPEARRLTDSGLTHFAAGRYDDAIVDFQKSYAVSPVPGLLYNLAQAYRLTGNCGRALDHYRRFLAADPAGKIRQRTQERIAEMEACAASAAPEPEARAPEPNAPEATPAAPAPTPARARALAPLPGAVRAGTAPSPVGAALADDGGRPRGAAPAWRRWVGVGLAGTAAALAGGSGYFAWRARQATDDVNQIYDRGGTWGPYAAGREDSGMWAERWALMSGAGAVVSAALALWLLVAR